MKMNAGVWIGLIGGLIGLIVGVGAVVTTAGPAGKYIALGMILIFGGIFFLIYKLLIGPAIMNSRLQKTGLDGKALIKEVRDTGVTINNNPQVKLIVEIKNYLGQTYTTTLRVLVSRINPFAYQPGMTVPVKIDPNNENNVAIAVDGGESQTNKMGGRTAAAPTYNTADVAALQKELEDLQKANDAILLTGVSARAIIKKYTWLGAYVNGNNPYVEMVVEVLPASAPAFEATVKGVVGEQSIQKYQPGQEVYVKYDPLNQSKVTIDHS